MDLGETKEILQSFKQPGVDWIKGDRDRSMGFKSLVNTGDRREIAKVANTLMRRHHELNTKQKNCMNKIENY